MNLRPYQSAAIDRLRESLRAGNKRIVLQAPVAFGKTIVSAAIIDMMREKNPSSRAIFTAPAISLIDQTVARFHENGVYDVGVIQANHPMTNYARPVQVASVQTLMRRKFPQADLALVDECHLCFEFVYKWMQLPEWKDVPFIGLSATPWARGMGAKGRWDGLIVAETMEGLTDQGYLSPLKYFAPMEVDVTGVGKVAGDFNEGQLSEVSRNKVVLSNTIEKWIELGENRPTIAFCVDRAHAQDMQARFNECGVPCGYIDARTEAADRTRLGLALKSGELKVVASVGCLIMGVDWPWVSCVLHARRTLSPMLWVQSVGRGVRIYPEKKDCLLLDCAGNRHLGHPYDMRFDTLDDGSKKARSERKEKEQSVPKSKECKSCGALRPAGVRKCPVCGFEPAIQSDVVEGEADLYEIGRGGKVKGRKSKKPEDWRTSEKQEFMSGLLVIQKERDYKPTWAAMQFKEKFGDWPSRHGVREIPAADASPAVRSWVRHRMIKYAKSKEKERVQSCQVQ